MSPFKIQPLGSAPLAAPLAAPTAKPGAKPGAKPVDAKLARVCDEFEISFLHQLLQAAKIGGKEMEHGYGAMAVDALAGGIQAGGGLGLARAIQHALEHQHEAPVQHAAPAAPAAATTTRKP